MCDAIGVTRPEVVFICSSFVSSQSVTTTLLARSTWPTLTLYSGLLFKCAAGISASSNADASSSFFWKVVVLQDGLLLLSLFTYLLVGADLVESGPR